jgi:hypothetical protein
MTSDLPLFMRSAPSNSSQTSKDGVPVVKEGVMNNLEQEELDLGINTSSAAYDAIIPNLSRLQRMIVYTYIKLHGPCTQHQLVAAMAHRGMAESTHRKRVIELVRQGLVKQAGVVRLPNGNPAKTWEIT